MAVTYLLRSAISSATILHPIRLDAHSRVSNKARRVESSQSWIAAVLQSTSKGFSSAIWISSSFAQAFLPAKIGMLERSSIMHATYAYHTARVVLNSWGCVGVMGQEA